MPTKVAVLVGLGICKRWASLIAYACFGFAHVASAQTGTAEGDIELGAYLSAECVSCHQANTQADGIPQIVGLDPDTFIEAMLAYKTKQREHPIMQMMAGRLNEEEIAALAAYFATLN